MTLPDIRIPDLPITPASPPTPTPPTVILPRWLVRGLLVLCPYFALLIGGHALALLVLDPFQGVGGVLTLLFWLGVAGFSLTVLVLGIVYLVRMEPGLSRAARWRLGIAFALVMTGTGGLAVAHLLAVG